MPAPPKHRGAIVWAAATLFRRNGYAATGINEIAELAGAPKGSLYHYFPDGKDQIGEAAVRFAGKGSARKSGKARAGAQDRSRHGAGLLPAAGRLDGEVRLSRRLSDLDDAPGVGAAIVRALRAPVAKRFPAGDAVIARALAQDGFSHAEARRLSTLAVCAIEGSLILSRVESSAQPIEDVARSLAVVLRRDTPPRRRTAGRKEAVS